MVSYFIPYKLFFLNRILESLTFEMEKRKNSITLPAVIDRRDMTGELRSIIDT